MRFFLPLLLVFASLSCNQNRVANLDALVAPQGDMTGTGSVRAKINFTDFTQPPGPGGADENLRLRFTNPEGDVMDFMLAPVGGAFPVGRYLLTGGANAFEASFTVTFEGTPTRVEVTTTNGYLDITAITITEGVVSALEGAYSVDFTLGGAGEGTIGFGG